MSMRDLHFNPDVFDDPDAFRPERWEVGRDKRRVMDRFWIPFGKGPRACVGRELALAELVLVVGNLWARVAAGWGLEVVDMREAEGEFRFVGDWFVPVGVRGRGLRVLVR